MENPETVLDFRRQWIIYRCLKKSTDYPREVIRYPCMILTLLLHGDVLLQFVACIACNGVLQMEVIHCLLTQVFVRNDVRSFGAGQIVWLCRF